MSERDDELALTLSEIHDLRRGYADFFGWPMDRDREELGVVEALAEALSAAGGPHLSEAKSRGRGEDPPDCEALDQKGERVAIEVTERVDGDTIQKYLQVEADRARAGIAPGAAVSAHELAYPMAHWRREDFVAKLTALVQKKDKRGRGLKGGPYPGGYLVAIFSDEPMLVRPIVEAYMRDLSAIRVESLTQAFLLLSYDPGEKRYPAIPIPLAPSSCG